MCIIAAALTKNNYGLPGVQRRLIFGTIVAKYTLTMIFTGLLLNELNHRCYGLIAGLIFLAGYLPDGILHNCFSEAYTGSYLMVDAMNIPRQ